MISTLSAIFLTSIVSLQHPEGYPLAGQHYPHFSEWKDLGGKSPYHAIKQDLMQRIKAGNAPGRESLEALSIKNPDDPVLAFKFGVVTVETLRGKDGETQRVAQYKVFVRMVRAKNPKDYEYTRLLYYVGYHRNYVGKLPAEVHKKICLARAEDDEITIIAAWNWSAHEMPAERLLAIEVLRQLSVKKPNDFVAKSRHAAAWAFHAMLTKSKSDALTALKLLDAYVLAAEGKHKYDKSVIAERRRILVEIAK
ncbi:hypothetical protein QPK87_37820 [Kamptonema cortianum]|nr:hypothetical protein [Geitlerinema splendidum]MDK3162266.1 hypothetical protein [Kamptonema cortianum]